MRLLMVTSSFPPIVGGVQTYAVELARRFAETCKQFTLVAPKHRGAAAYDRAAPFEVVRLPSIGDDLALTGALPLAVIATKRRYDAAFCTHWATAHAVLASRRIDRVYTAAHGKELIHRPLSRISVAQRVYDGVRRRALRGSTAFFPVSSYTRDLLIDRGIAPSRITVVHNGVDPARFAPTDASELRASLGGGGRVLLTVARLVPRKGIDTILRALPAITSKIPDLTYVVVGDGPDRARLEDLIASLRLGSRVRLLGRVDGDVSRYMNACDLFVMPAREEREDVEGFGLVFLEAGACERAVVGARAGGTVDAVVDGETGRLVPPDDPAALADAVTALLIDSEARQRMGRRARERILASGTWDHAAQRILGVIGA